MALRRQKFKRNPRFEEQVRRGVLYDKGLNDVAERVARAARREAPERTGDYRDSIETDGRRVLTTDFAGHIIEWGSVKTPPYAPLRRGARAAGLRLSEDTE